MLESTHKTSLLPGPSSRQPAPRRRASLVPRVALTVVGIAAVVAAACVGALVLRHSTSSRASASNSRVVAADDSNVNVRVGDAFVSLSVEGTSAFRVGVSFVGNATRIETPMVPTHTKAAKATVSRSGTVVALSTDFGKVQIDSSTGMFVLFDADGNTLTSVDQLVPVTSHKEMQGDKDSACTVRSDGYDVNGPPPRTPSCPNGLSGKSQDECCQACDSDSDCTVWVWAKPGHESEGKNCWLMMSSTPVALHTASDRVAGGSIQAPPRETTVRLHRSSDAKFYGSGCGTNDAQTLTQTQSYSKVANTEFRTPHYHTTDKYTMLGVSPVSFKPGEFATYPSRWDATDGSSVVWSIMGNQFDLYFVPAASQGEGLSRYWDLTGRAPVPPRYAFGFHASRWGWTNYEYVTGILDQFRGGNFPLDSWISDFEWYTDAPDYNLPWTGSPTFDDFGYDATIFPDPVNNLKTYHTKYNVKFGGIRKPRLGNSDLLTMVKSKGWNVDNTNYDGGPRNLNYTIEDVRAWYIQETAHFLKDGVDYYWNDEGESYYFAFYYWNLAQFDGQNQFNSSKRFFTINRSYTPGMQRLGATQWTGDVQVSWQSMQNQPGYVLNWGLAGTPYVTCDTGGFNGGEVSADLLTRWYQVATFMPIMRVHSTHDAVPHFPFLFGDDAANAMRKALNLRYQLIPYHYSLAHQAYLEGGLPIFRPMLLAFPDDASVRDLTWQWMDGDGVVVCPVMNQDGSVQCVLPAGQWYEFETGAAVNGGQTLSLTNVALDHIPVYARAGAVVPMGPVIQHVGQLPGGPLEVVVFGGSDGSFTLFEDDGETRNYESGLVRATTYKWDDSSSTLSWSVDGTFTDASVFQQVMLTHISPSGTKTSDAKAIGTSGSITA